VVASRLCSLLTLKERNMDPEANLREQLEIAQQLYDIDDMSEEDRTDEGPDEVFQLALRLAELVFALHKWNRDKL